MDSMRWSSPLTQTQLAGRTSCLSVDACSQGMPPISTHYVRESVRHVNSLNSSVCSLCTHVLVLRHGSPCDRVMCVGAAVGSR